ncbi:MAG: type I-E CRISPR-associated protein Cas5/CasD [Meiothermus sp.]|nr:type I-E CRISPR-associated protein Cas5/CasD [Meiothermus sp.]
MGSPVLLLRLEGPLQSWGGRSRWDVRDTQPEPTKSGVIGLLGCAMGLERGDSRLEELDRGLRFGVRVEAPGRVLEDYQTVTDFLPTAAREYKHSGVKTSKSLQKLREDPTVEPSTIISPRYYLEDASFLVALETQHHLGPSLAEIAEAVQSPRWTLFLGRKSCVPTRPVFDAYTAQYEGLEDALHKHPWSWLGRDAVLRRIKPERLVAYLEQEDGPYRRQDAFRVNPLRQYGFVAMRRISVQGVI